MTAPVTIVGGGVAGLSLAWALTKRGRRVDVWEAGTVGGGASAVATSYMEPRLGRTPARRLEWEAVARWPLFATEVEATSGMAVGFRPDGQLRFAFADTEADVRADLGVRREGGWDADWVDGPAVRAAVPDISDAVTGAALVRGPAWCDGPALCRALAEAVRRRDGTIREGATFTGREAVPGPLVVANGPGAEALRDALPALPAVRLTKGTTLLYRCDVALPHMLRSRDVSIVPRDGALVVGSSRERGATGLEPDPDVVRDLHARAVRVLPALAHVAPEPRCGWRTLVGDGSLNLGCTEDRQVFWSLSHAGVGYLRAPLVAAEMASWIDGGALALCAPFARAVSSRS